MLQFVQTVNSYLADYILIILLIGTGIYFTMRTRFVQIRCFGEGMKKVFGNFSLHGGKQHGGISSFQALTTAIAAQVGHPAVGDGGEAELSLAEELGLDAGEVFIGMVGADRLG